MEPGGDLKKPDLIIQVASDRISIPDISFLTSVALPEIVDLRDRDPTVSLLQLLIEEEIGRNTKYKGAFLHGSLSRNEAKNESDVDLLHVIADEYDIALWPIRYRLMVIFKEFYGITIDDARHILKVSDLKGRNLSFVLAQNCEELDRDSIAMIEDKSLIEEIEKLTGLRDKPPYIGDRPHKTQSRETNPHCLLHADERDIVLPWYANYGLIKRS